MTTRLLVLLARVVGVFTGTRRDARLADEVGAHLDALAAGHEARGLSPSDARNAARRDFGGIDQMTERYRDQSRWQWIDAAGGDVRLAVRRLRTEPWFSAAVILALAIGIGGSVSVTAAVTAIAWSHPPFQDPDGVMAIGTVDEQGRRGNLSWLDYEDWRSASRGIDCFAGFSGAFFTIAPDGRAAERVQGAYVSHELFALLGLQPERGRDFVIADDQPGAASVVLVGHDVADTLLGGADHAVGQAVLVDGVPTTVIGVMRSGVSFPLDGDVWRPLAQLSGLREGGRERRVISAVARLAPGVATATALAELAVLAERSASAPAGENVRVRPTMTTFREHFLGRTTDPVPVALLVVAGMVLLVGCATAATLLFARSTYRVDETTMRAALGASRRRLVFLLLAECAVCAVAAGVVGLVIARLFLSWFGETVAGAGLPPWVRFTIEPRVVAIAAVATVASTALGGLAPAWRLSSAALARVPSGTRSSNGSATQRWIRVLLIVKVALTLVLLSTSGYLLSGAMALWRADQRMNTSGVVTARLGLSGPLLGTADQRLAFTRRFVERLEVRRDLTAVSISSGPPFSALASRRVAVDSDLQDARRGPTARVAAVDARYFSTLAVTLTAGQSIPDRTDPSSPVAVVNAAFADRYLEDGAIGRRIQLAPSASETPAGPWLTVVGVSPSLRNSPRPEAEPAIYVPLALEHPATVFVMVRAAEGVPVADILREELRALDPTLALYGWQSLERMSEISRWTIRTMGSIVVVLGALALMLAALGVYAVTAYAAGRRTKEAGIRLSLGATSSDVMRLFARGALTPVGIGLGVGLVAGWGASRALLALVLGGADVGTPMLVPAASIVAAVAVVAAVLPARRVALRDPLRALRCD